MISFSHSVVRNNRLWDAAIALKDMADRAMNFFRDVLNFNTDRTRYLSDRTNSATAADPTALCEDDNDRRRSADNDTANRASDSTARFFAYFDEKPYTHLGNDQ